MQIRTSSKDEALILRWLQLAVAKPRGRPILSGIHVRKDGIAEACDGFRIHQAPAPECLQEFKGKIVQINWGKKLLKSEGREYPARLMYGNYPDTDQIFEGVSGSAPKAGAAAVRSQYMIDALEMPVPIVKMQVLDEMDPILLEANNCNSFRALVMPMQCP